MIDENRIIVISDVRKQLCLWGLDHFLTSVNLTRKDFLQGKVTVKTLLDTKNALAEDFVRNLDAS